MDALAFLTEHGISLITLAIVLATVLKQPIQNLFLSKVERSKKRSTWELEMEERLLDRVLENGPRAATLVDRIIMLQSAHAAATLEQAEKNEKIVSTAITVMQDYAGVAASTVKQMEQHAEQHARRDEQQKELLQEMLVVLNRISQRLS